MAPMSYASRRDTRRRFDDDDDLYDDGGNGPYDKRYPGRRVIADKGRVNVPIMLSDAMPAECRDVVRSMRLNDAANSHRPHQLPLADGAARREVEDAYQALLSVGLGPLEARNRLDKVMAGGKTFTTVEEVLLQIYSTK